MKIEKIFEKDEREGAGITRYGTSPYRAIGFDIIAENEEDEKFLSDFEILYVDTNGYMETEREKKNIKIFTFKCW